MKFDRLSLLLCALACAVPASAFAESVADQKVAFLRTVDESISGGRLSGNPYKFVGKHVDLHCVVGPINDPDFFNAVCGDDQYIPIAIVHPTKSLEQGQQVRVLGVVMKPISSSSEDGGSHTYAIVKSLFME